MRSHTPCFPPPPPPHPPPTPTLQKKKKVANATADCGVLPPLRLLPSLPLVHHTRPSVRPHVCAIPPKDCRHVEHPHSSLACSPLPGGAATATPALRRAAPVPSSPASVPCPSPHLPSLPFSPPLSLPELPAHFHRIGVRQICCIMYVPHAHDVRPCASWSVEAPLQLAGSRQRGAAGAHQSVRVPCLQLVPACNSSWFNTCRRQACVLPSFWAGAMASVRWAASWRARARPVRRHRGPAQPSGCETRPARCHKQLSNLSRHLPQSYSPAAKPRAPLLLLAHLPSRSTAMRTETGALLAVIAALMLLAAPGEQQGE